MSETITFDQQSLGLGVDLLAGSDCDDGGCQLFVELDETVSIDTLASIEAPEIRRTDDPLFNVKYLRQHIIDREARLFFEEAETDVLQQDLSDVAESDIHRLGVPVVQVWRDDIAQYVSLGRGTIDNAIVGMQSLQQDNSAEDSLFELSFRMEEAVEEMTVTNDRDRLIGGVARYISPPPAKHEADPAVAKAMGYDDRTMLRFQTVTKDGCIKVMRSYCVFDVPNEVWAQYFRDRYAEDVEDTALDIRQISNRHLIVDDTTVEEELTEVLEGVARYLDDEQKASVQEQLDDFLNTQDQLLERAMHYARERLEFEKDLALSESYAIGRVKDIFDLLYPNLNDANKAIVDRHSDGVSYRMDEAMERLALKLKVNTSYNRAGIAVGNTRTLQRVGEAVGEEQLFAMVEMEMRMLAAQDSEEADSIRRENERNVAEANVSCGGGCSITVVDEFGREIDVEADDLFKYRRLLFKNEVCENCSNLDSAGKKTSKVTKVKAIFDIKTKKMTCDRCGAERHTKTKIWTKGGQGVFARKEDKK